MLKAKTIRSKRTAIPVAVALAVVVCIAVTAWLLLSGRGTPVQPDAPTVVIDTVRTSSVNIYGDYVGRIRAKQFVEVHARVEGYLERMCFEEGTYIKKGQTLFVIDPTVYRASANKARAALAKAKAVQDKAQRDLDRIKPLYEQNAASRLDLDNAVAAYETAKADAAMAAAELQQAELTLSYTTVRSPISGMVSERNADIGTLVGPGAQSLLATVVNSDTVLVDFSMTALDYLTSRDRNVNIGAPNDNGKTNAFITVTMADGREYPDRGIVDFADPKVDPKTGTFSVRAEMPNARGMLLPGEFTRVKMLTDVRPRAIAVPQRAVEVEKGGAYIYVVRRDNTVERRFIETGPEFDNSIIVERGLAVGERIITDGINKVTHGGRVIPLTPDKAGNYPYKRV